MIMVIGCLVRHRRRLCGLDPAYRLWLLDFLLVLRLILNIIERLPNRVQVDMIVFLPWRLVNRFS